jgi:DNA-binding response OmpR family regulator
VDAWVRDGETRRSSPANVILVVDDDDLAGASVVDRLADRGYRVLLAADAEQALKLLEGSTASQE